MIESLADSTALILSGGLGTRLRSVVNDRPKVLALVAGRPYLAHLLDQLANAGLRRVVLCRSCRRPVYNPTVRQTQVNGSGAASWREVDEP